MKKDSIACAGIMSVGRGVGTSQTMSGIDEGVGPRSGEVGGRG